MSAGPSQISVVKELWALSMNPYNIIGPHCGAIGTVFVDVVHTEMSVFDGGQARLGSLNSLVPSGKYQSVIACVGLLLFWSRQNLH